MAELDWRFQTRSDVESALANTHSDASRLSIKTSPISTEPRRASVDVGGLFPPMIHHPSSSANAPSGSGSRTFDYADDTDSVNPGAEASSALFQRRWTMPELEHPQIRTPSPPEPSTSPEVADPTANPSSAAPPSHPSLPKPRPSRAPRRNTEKRKEQNRNAQRAFRARKEQRLRELEDLVAESNSKHHLYEAENQNLRTIIDHLKNENQHLSARIGSSGDSGPAILAPAPVLDARPTAGPSNQSWIDPNRLAMQASFHGRAHERRDSAGVNFSTLVRSVGERHLSASSDSAAGSSVYAGSDSGVSSASPVMAHARLVDNHAMPTPRQQVSPAQGSYFVPPELHHGLRLDDPVSFEPSTSGHPMGMTPTGLTGAAALPTEMSAFLTDDASMSGLDYLNSWDASALSLSYDHSVER